MIPLLHLTFLGEEQYGPTSHPSSEVDIRVFLKGFWFSVFLIGPSFAEYGHMVQKNTLLDGKRRRGAHRMF